MYDDLERPPLHADQLRTALVRVGSLWSEVTVEESVESTNAVLAERARNSAADGVVLVAEHQTAGRGRLERTWSAPSRSGLTFSVLVRPEVEAARWTWLPLLTGLAVAAAVQHETGCDARLKWPNDIVVGEGKLAGLLVERVESEHGAAAVVGVGLNVSLRPDELPVDTATSLAIERASTTDRTVLLLAMLRSFEGLFGRWQQQGGDPSDGLLAAYTDACVTIGRDVRVVLAEGDERSGRAVGVDGSGRLLVQTPFGLEVYGAGDVVHLRPRA
jgi:BirA family biotin operon repressor/biotin-[acetyl-CoA-carboxylase] ligase